MRPPKRLQNLSVPTYTPERRSLRVPCKSLASQTQVLSLGSVQSSIQPSPRHFPYFSPVLSFIILQSHPLLSNQPTCLFFFFKVFIYLFIWLCWVLVAACGIFSCGMWDLVPWQGIEPRLPAMGVRSLGHWTTREVPQLTCLDFIIHPAFLYSVPLNKLCLHQEYSLPFFQPINWQWPSPQRFGLELPN